MNDQRQPCDELDRQLRDWAQRRSRGEQQLDALRSRIVDEALRPSSERVEKQAALAAPTGNKIRWLGVSLIAGLAAGLLLMFAWPQLQPTTEPPTDDVAEVDPAAAGAPEGVAWEAGQLQGKSMLAAELEQLFPQQWQWIVESGGDSSIQVGSASSGQDPRAVAVRISVVKRAAGETAWTPVWMVDCVSRSEALVQFESTTAGDASLLLWTYPVNGDLVAVDCQLVLGDEDAMQTNYSVVQPRGVPTQASAVLRGDTEYAVFQTVSLLDGEASL